MLSWSQLDGDQSLQSRVREAREAVSAAKILEDLVDYLQSIRDHRQDKIAVLVPRPVAGTSSLPAGMVAEDRETRSMSNEAKYLSPERYYLNSDKND